VFTRQPDSTVPLFTAANGPKGTYCAFYLLTDPGKSIISITLSDSLYSSQYTGGYYLLANSAPGDVTTFLQGVNAYINTIRKTGDRGGIIWFNLPPSSSTPTAL